MNSPILNFPKALSGYPFALVNHTLLLPSFLYHIQSQRQTGEYSRAYLYVTKLQKKKSSSPSRSQDVLDSFYATSFLFWLNLFHVTCDRSCHWWIPKGLVTFPLQLKTEKSIQWLSPQMEKGIRSEPGDKYSLMTKERFIPTVTNSTIQREKRIDNNSLEAAVI